MKILFLSFRGSGGTGTSVDIGTGATQVPNNTIVQNTINEYITNIVGTDPDDIPTNEQITVIINQNNTTLQETINSLTQTINNVSQQTTNVSNQVTNIVNNPEIVRPFMEAVCTESLEEGMYIKAYRDGTETKCCRTDAVNGLLADGFVLQSYAVGATVKYYDSGENEKGNDLGAGKLYLSTVDKGRASLSPPLQKSGHWFQEIGESVGPNRHRFKLGLTIHLL